jgi:hypothetical protein
MATPRPGKPSPQVTEARAAAQRAKLDAQDAQRQQQQTTAKSSWVYPAGHVPKALRNRFRFDGDSSSCVRPIVCLFSLSIGHKMWKRPRDFLCISRLFRLFAGFQ